MLAKEVRIGDRLCTGGTIISINTIGGNVLSFVTDDGKHLLYNAKCGELNAYHTENSIPLHGERCLVSDDWNEWTERIFLYENEHGKYTVSGVDEKNFHEGKHYDVVKWKYCKLLPKVECIKVDISIRINGELSELSDISEETLLKIYRKLTLDT